MSILKSDKYEKKVESELTLNNYSGHYGNLIVAILLFLILFLTIIYPGLYHKNLFWTFIEFYKHEYIFQLLGLLGMIGLFSYSMAQFLILPFKITFPEECIHIYSLHSKGSCVIRWENLTEFRFIERVRSRYQVTREYMQIVIASDQYSTKILGSLGPTFRLLDFFYDNALVKKKVLELYEKKCPQLANSESIDHA
jgi:hypothetical protein